MSYSAQVQEKYFRTVRIQIVEERLHKDWYVVQRDVVAPTKPTAIVTVLSRYDRRTGAREWEPLGYMSGAPLYKGEALELAKAEAIALALPFDPKRDLVNIKDVEQGPVQKCVACGQDAGRGRRGARRNCSAPLVGYMAIQGPPSPPSAHWTMNERPDRD
jgi:hypothetical protein